MEFILLFIFIISIICVFLYNNYKEELEQEKIQKRLKFEKKLKKQKEKEEIEREIKSKTHFLCKDITSMSFIEIASTIKDKYQLHLQYLEESWKDLYEIVLPKVFENKELLLKKRYNKVYIDDYNIRHVEEWVDELDYFLKNIIHSVKFKNVLEDISVSYWYLLRLSKSLEDIDSYIKYRKGIALPIENTKTKYRFLEYSCKKINFNLEDVFEFEVLFVPFFDNIDEKNHKINFKIKPEENKETLEIIHDTEPNLLECSEKDEIAFYNFVINLGLSKSVDEFLDLFDFEDDNYNIKKESNISPLEFEKDICVKLKKLGFRAETTKASGDQGVDVIAERNDIKFAIQCKFYSSPVGNKAVQEVCAGRDFYDADYGVVVTNNTYTPAAKKLADKNEIILLNDSELERLLKLCE